MINGLIEDSRRDCEGDEVRREIVYSTYVSDVQVSKVGREEVVHRCS